jgi:hypothetical protein
MSLEHSPARETEHSANCCYTIGEFCRDHRISRSLYYILKKQGIGPREMLVQSRRVISPEAALDWRRAREAAAIAVEQAAA